MQLFPACHCHQFTIQIAHTFWHQIRMHQANVEETILVDPIRTIARIC
jgi:hypothetical protein